MYVCIYIYIIIIIIIYIYISKAWGIGVVGFTAEGLGS